MIDSLNWYLLSRFAQNIRVGQDIKSLLKRYQLLSVIYINICISLVALTWNIGSFFLPLPLLAANLSILPLMFVSFVFLRHGNHDAAVISVLSYFHLAILTIGKFSNAALTGLCITIVCPSCSFLLTSSRKIHLINFCFCIIQHFSLLLDVSHTFRSNFTMEQTAEIIQLQLASLLAIGLLASFSYIQKYIETNLWQLAQSNFERAEKINKEVMQAIESKDTFVSSLSHEIRNPLNALKGSIDYLLSVIKNQAHLKILEHAHLSSEVLLNLLNNVLDAAKLKADKMELAYAESSLIEIVKKVMAIYSNRLREKQINVELMIDRKIPALIWMDSSRVLQIIMNLFSNAVKFTPVDGKINFCLSWCHRANSRVGTTEDLLTPIKNISSSSDDNNGKRLQEFGTEENIVPTIEKFLYSPSNSLTELDPKEKKKMRNNIRKRTFHTKSIEQIILNNVHADPRYFIWHLRGTMPFDTQQFVDACGILNKSIDNNIVQNGYLKIEISDTGSGIAQEYIPTLFEMFSQAGQNISSVYGGSGLGLWICKQLCQKMGGDITLYTQVDKGTAFVFYIPVNNRSIHTQNFGIPLERTISVQDQRVRVLVVDDYAYNRDIHKLLLEREGVQVSTANDGKEALAKYTAQSDGFYDFIMMDIQMPEMDGFTSARKIREWEDERRWHKADIYFVSGEYYSEEEIKKEMKTTKSSNNPVGIRVLRKPIDVELIRKVVEKYKNIRKQLLEINLLETQKIY